MQKIAEKLLKNFVLNLKKSEMDSIKKDKILKDKILKNASQRSENLYRRLNRLQRSLENYWETHLADRFIEGVSCGILLGLETRGALKGKGFIPLKKGEAEMHGEFWQSVEQMLAENRYDRERSGFDRSCTKEEQEIAEQLYICTSDIFCVKEEYYWDEGMRIGILFGSNAATMLQNCL